MASNWDEIQQNWPHSCANDTAVPITAVSMSPLCMSQWCQLYHYALGGVDFWIFCIFDLLQLNLDSQKTKKVSKKGQKYFCSSSRSIWDQKIRNFTLISKWVNSPL
jgi:hypothetical protein